MRCQNCKHLIFGDCTITGKPVMPDSLCNAWELSLSWGQVVEMQPTTDGVAELQARIAELEGIIRADDERLIEAGLSVNLFSGCDTAETMAAIIIASRDRIAELERRIAEAKSLLEDEMVEWGATENNCSPDHFLQLKQVLDVLDEGGE